MKELFIKDISGVIWVDSYYPGNWYGIKSVFTEKPIALIKILHFVEFLTCFINNIPYFIDNDHLFT